MSNMTAVEQAHARLDAYFNDAHCPPELRADWELLQIKRDTLKPMGEQGNEWYFDCDNYYIDVARYPKDGTYSVYFRLRDDNSEGWWDQADDPQRRRTPISLEEFQHIAAGLLFSPPRHSEKIKDQEALRLYTSGWRAMGTAVLNKMRRAAQIHDVVKRGGVLIDLGDDDAQ